MSGSKKSGWRWLYRIPLAIVLLLVLAVGGAFAALQTEWGREIVRTQTEKLLDEVFVGQIHIGHIEGFLPTRPIVRDVVITDGSGRDAIAARLVTAEIRLIPFALGLLDQRVELDVVNVLGVGVNMVTNAKGIVNLAELVVPADPALPPTPDWSVAIASARVDDGRFVMTTPSSTTAFDRLELHADFASTGSNVEMHIARIASHLDVPDVRVELSAEMKTSTRTFELSEIVGLVDGRPTVLYGTLVLDIDSGRMRAVVDAIGEPALWATLTGTDDWRARARVQADIRRPTTELPWRIGLRGKVSGAPITASATATPDFSQVMVTLAVDKVDPADIHRAAPRGMLGLRLEGNAMGATLNDLQGHVRAEVAGDVATSTKASDTRYPLLLSLTGEADKGKIRTRFDAHSAGARARGDAAIDVAAEPVTIDRARVTIASKDLARVPLGALELQGAITATLAASGTLRDLKVEANANGSKIRINDTRIEQLRVQGALSGLPDRSVGRLQVEAKNLRQLDQRIGNVRIDARGEQRGKALGVALSLDEGQLPRAMQGNLRIEHDAKQTRVAITRLDLMTANLTWRVENARAAYNADGSIELKDFVLTSPAGKVTADAELSADLLGGSGWAKASLEAKDIGLVRADLAPKLPRIDGRADVRFEAKTGPSGSARLTAVLTDVRYPGLTHPAQMQVAALLVPGSLTASAAVDGQDLGALTVVGSMRAPRRPLEPAAWADIDAHDVRAIDVSLTNLDLSRVAPMVPDAGLLGGRVDGEIHATPALAKVDMRLDARGVRHTHLPGPIEFKLEGHANDERTGLTLAAGVGGTPLAALALRLDIGAATLASHPERAVAPRTNAEVELDLDQFPIALLADLRNEPPGITITSVRQAYRGEISMRGTVKRTAKKLSGQIEVNGSRLVWVEGASAITATVSATLDDNQLAISAIAEGNGIGVIDLAVTGHTPVDALDVGAWQALGTNAIHSLTLDASAVDLGSIDRMTNRGFPVKGRLDARIIGSSGLRKIDGRVELRGLANRDSQTVFDTFISLAGGGKSTDLEAEVAYKNQRVATATASLAIDFPRLVNDLPNLAKVPLSAELAVHDMPLEGLAGALSMHVPVAGTLSATAALAGTLENYVGTIHLDAGKAEVKDQRFEYFLADLRIDRTDIEAHARAQEEQGGSMSLDAKLGLALGAPIQADLRSRDFRLDFLSAFFQGQRSVGGITGVMDASLAIEGTRDAPAARGKVDLRDLFVVLTPPIPSIDRTSAALTFDGNKIAAKVSGRSAKGKFEATGNVELVTLMQPKFEVVLTTDDMPFAAGPRLARVDAHVTAKGQVTDKLQAEVIIDKGLVEITSDGVDTLKPVRAFNDVIFTDEPPPSAALGDPKAAQTFPIDITVKTASDIPLRGKEVNATASVDLHIQSNKGLPNGSGVISVGNGWATFFGKRWEIRRADITLLGNEEPRLEVEISRDVGNATALVRVHGTPTAPELDLTSDPPIYDEAQVLMFVLGADPSTGEPGSIQDTAAGAAAGALVGALQSKIEDKLPLDTIKVELKDGAKIGKLTLGKWISRRIFLGYDFVFEAQDDENTNEALVQFRLGRGWVVESRYGDRGVGGVDVIWVKRF